MKYEEWIRYEELRKQQTDLFAWIASDEHASGPGDPNNAARQPENPRQRIRQNLWIVIVHRFFSSRI